MRVSVFDVAAYILEKLGPITAMKLQKLCYYAQAWAVVWDDEALFRERIEAWANGPVVPALYNAHRGRFKVSKVALGNPDRLNASQKKTIDSVLDWYGHRTSQYLSDLTHREDPWLDARKDLDAASPSNASISLRSLYDYYSAL